MNTVLVTGGAGFIGCNFVRLLLEKEPNTQVIVFDALTYAGSLENLKDIAKDIIFIKGNINNRQDLKRVFVLKPDTIVHFAAETHVDRSICFHHILLRQMLVEH